METPEEPGYAERDAEPVSPQTGGGVHGEDAPPEDQPEPDGEPAEDDEDVDLTG
jgi:hypothetical protein